jgi:bifunctional DNase/RNase
MNKIKLEVIAISQSQGQSGAYTVFLQDLISKKQLRIIIGAAEAQSIAFALENIKPPRPLTHDVFKNFCDAFSIKIIEVNITQLIDNVFYAKLICSNDHKLIDIDSRTSDAIAMALRFDCPIFTNELVLKTANEIEFNTPSEKTKKDVKLKGDNYSSDSKSNEYEFFPLEELEELLKEAIENEDYEKASKIRDEIKKRKHS